ncbi:hypothetical protein Ga0123462_0775 [Mariprofundus ferrinatatus]|uniref:Uncharacterized protein n=1 Tax=Mariprofundus ferrinatatus TaxID=1921087 RepID=A0A2K8L2T9_9PROT|nr:DUF6629 family protein [Mariprofundus ferrinatatus]ATX81645.1 hypothetical protein Ga0123462_0775 [Mariprofundus ferrinatatus]
MCFSATASFIVGGSLIAVGAVTLKLVKEKRELAFAMIPLLFGVQQLVEGVLWSSFHYNIPDLRTAMTYMFTMFSHVLWPIYVPFAVGLLETDPWRCRAMWVFRFIGVSVSVHLLLLIILMPLNAVADQHVIYISPRLYEWPMMFLYITATCLVSLFSSHRIIRFFGALAILMFIISYAFYTVAFFSVWCFFAAILSVIILIFFRGRRGMPVT